MGKRSSKSSRRVSHRAASSWNPTLRASIDAVFNKAKLERLENRLLLSGTPDFTVGGTLGSNTHWFGTVEVTSNLTVAGGVTVTIDPGTVIKSTQGVGITVDGTVDAMGTAAAPIIFTTINDDTVGTSLTSTGTSTGVAGSWDQIVFAAGSDASIVQNAQIRFAGNANNPGNTSFFRPAIQITSSKVDLSNVQVLNSDQEGINIASGNPTLNTVLVDHARDQAFEVSSTALPSYSALSATNDSLDGVQLDGGTISGAETWNFGGLPVQISGSFTIASTGALTIVPGQVVKWYNGGSLTVNGTLNAQGTAGEPIIFTSYRDDSAGGDTNADGPSSGVAGDWQSIVFNAGSDASVLQNVQIDYAGNQVGPGNPSWFKTALQVNSSLHLQNVQVNNSDWEAIFTGAGSPTYTNVSVNTARKQAFETVLAATPTLLQLSAANTSLNGYELDGGTISANRELSFGGLVGVINGSLTVAT
ncbi:MAG TPA: hypothetical protein VK797_12085, partial [Tepidisphaeraceae bacterium]|nr:hypothetical protein [Tepidisphaeraceae bacterium]